MSPTEFQKHIIALFEYSPKTGKFTRKVRTSTNTHVGDIAGSNNKYSQIRINGRAYRANRLAWLYVHGSWPTGQIDHKDRDPTNDRITNLRDVTQSVNQHNVSRRADNWSGQAGVTWNARTGKWRARIHADKKAYFLGAFDSLTEASAAYQAAKRIYHPTAPVAQ